MAKSKKIKGTKSDDNIQGTGGVDKIDARHGDDVVHAGGGSDKVKCGKGEDTLYGEAGDDYLDGGKDNDYLDGGAGNDRLKGGQGEDELQGGLGDDTLTGGSGADTLFGGEGNDKLFGDGSGSGSGRGSGSGEASFNDYLDGGAGDDLIVGGAGDDTLLGGEGNDSLYGDGMGSGSGSHGGRGSGSGSGGRSGHGSGSGGGRGKKGKGSGSGSGSHDHHGSGSGDGEGVTFNDYLDGGAGDDLVFGQQGDDTGYWYMQENLGATDAYDGGTGTDALVFALTYGEAADAGVQADLAGFDAFLAFNSNPNTDNGATYNFTSFATLDLTDWEGYSVELINTGPTANADTGATDEDTVLVVSDVADGLLNNDTDPDHLDVLTVAGFDATSEFGAGVTVNPDGTYSYDATSAAFLQALAVGETALDTFSYTISDLAGVESTSTVTIEVTGVNDAPMITDGGDIAGDVQEDVTLTFTGDLDSTDVDNGATAEWSVANSAGTYGSLAVDGITGTWTYTLDNNAENVQALAAGESHDEEFTVIVTDDQGATDTQTVTITVNGTNDAPVIASSATASITNSSFETDLSGWTVTGNGVDRVGGWEASDGSVSLDLNAFNPGGIQQSIATEAGATYTVTFDLAGNPGQQTIKTLDVSADGTSQTYSFDNAGTSATNMGWVTQSFTFVAVDDSTLLSFDSLVPSGAWGPALDNVQITRDGYNVQEDATQSVSGDLDSTDVDNGATATWSVAGSGAGTYGDMSVDSNGTWTYGLRNADANVQALAVGETHDETFTIVVTDDKGATDTQTVTVKVTGTNDAPVAQDVTLEVNQLGNGGFDSLPDFDGWNVDLSLTNATLPNGSSFYCSTAVVDRSGTAISGDDAVAVLEFGAQVPTPGGTGFGPTITSDAFDGQAGDTVRFVYELSSSGDYARGNGYIRDADTGAIVQTIFDYQTPFSGSTGVQQVDLTLAQSGEFIIDFRVGSYDATFGYYVGAKLELGFAGIIRDGLSEDTPFTFAGEEFLSGVTDIDGGAPVLHSVSATSANGASVVIVAGDVVYDPSGALDHLAAGEELIDTFEFTVSDGNGGFDTATASIKVIGENDGPVAVADSNSGSEGNESIASVAITGDVLANDTDVDSASSGFTVTTAGVITGSYGTLTLNADGTYSYAIDDSNAAVDALNVGDSLTESFNYTMSDNQAGNPLTSSSTLEITINGTNDAPVAQDVTLEVNQLGNGGFDLAPDFGGWNVDTSLSNMTSGFGNANIDRSGNLLGGDDAVAVLEFGGQVPSRYGTGEGPTITSDPFDGQAGDTVRFVYQLSSGGDYARGNGYIRDADTGAIVQTIFDYQTPFTGSTGVQQVDLTLAQSGEFLIDFRVGSYDATGGYYVGAKLELGFAGIIREGVSEDEPFTFVSSEFLSGVTDVDDGTAVLDSVSATSANGASVVIVGGDVVYDPSGALDHLAAGEQLVDTFEFTVSDGNGGFDTATASVTVIGENDAPEAEADKTAIIADDAGEVSLNIHAPTDVDGDTLAVTVTGVPTGVGLVLLNGSTVVNGQVMSVADLVSLTFDASGTPGASGGFSYSVSDGNGGVDAANISIDLIDGVTSTFEYVGSYRVSDGPIWTSNPEVYSAKEAAALVFGGQAADYTISITDSTDPGTVTGTGWYDAWGAPWSVRDDDFQLDSGGAGYNNPGGSNSAISAYVRDHVDTTKVNYAWRSGEEGVDQTLTGGAGSDVLVGGAGDDSLTGLGGDDLFVFRDGFGDDTITDFTAGIGTDDKIDVSDFGLNNLADLLASSNDVGSNTVINLDGNDSLTLIGVQEFQLHEDDFLF